MVRWQGLNFKARLLLFVWGFGAVVTVVGSGVAYFYLQRSLESGAIARITVARDVKKRHVEQILAQTLDEFERLASRIGRADSCAEFLRKAEGRLALWSLSAETPLCPGSEAEFRDFAEGLSRASLAEEKAVFFDWNGGLYILRRITRDRVLVLALGEELLNPIMTDDRNWDREGFGKTGETYIVGADHRMRTDSRFLPPGNARPRVETLAVMRAASGELGIEVMPDYRGIPVFSAFSPITFPTQAAGGARWVVLSEIDVSEVYLPLQAYLKATVWATLIVMGLVTLGAWWLANSFAAPLQGIVRVTRKVRDEGLDRDWMEDWGSRSDEFGVLARSFDSMLQAIRSKEREQVNLERRFVEFAEAEKQHFGQDLHDLVGQDLLGISYILRGIQERAGPALALEFEKVSGLLRQTVARVRSLSTGLCPVVIEDEGLVLALMDLAKNTMRLYDVACFYSGVEQVSSFNKETANLTYRIAQEAVTNAVKHARARKIEISLVTDSEAGFCLTVSDDGLGFKSSSASGLGLHLMKLRAQSLGARLSFESPPNHGTKIICRIPRSGALSSSTTTSL